MSELDLMHVLWSIVTIASVLSNIGLLIIYRSYEKSLDEVLNILMRVLQVK